MGEENDNESDEHENVILENENEIDEVEDTLSEEEHAGKGVTFINKLLFSKRLGSALL